jgi:hypothetical protein
MGERGIYDMSEFTPLERVASKQYVKFPKFILPLAPYTSSPRNMYKELLDMIKVIYKNS